MTHAEDRRKVNKWRQKIYIGVSISVISSSFYGVYAAGQTAEKIDSAQKDIVALEDFRNSSIANAAHIKQISKTQDKTVEILEKVEDRLRFIELKIEAQHKHQRSLDQ